MVYVICGILITITCNTSFIVSIIAITLRLQYYCSLHLCLFMYQLSKCMLNFTSNICCCATDVVYIPWTDVEYLYFNINISLNVNALPVCLSIKIVNLLNNLSHPYGRNLIIKNEQLIIYNEKIIYNKIPTSSMAFILNVAVCVFHKSLMR